MVISTLVVAGLAIAGTRFIRSTKTLQSATAPTSDVQALITYLAPLPADSAPASIDSGIGAIVRDPFVEVSTSAASMPAPTTAGDKSKRPRNQRWVVTSVLLEGSRRSAIVNDVWVNVGDSIVGGSRLTAVERDHVVVTDANGVRHKVAIQGGET